MNKVKKIGIYTIHSVFNYGAQLQAYATIFYLKKIFPYYDIELVNIELSSSKLNLKQCIKKLLPQQILRSFRFRRFHNKNPLSPKISLDKLFNEPFSYDLHITGSDQIWNVSKGIGKYPVYFLPFVKKEPKIALASSFGTKQIPLDTYSFVKKYLGQFDSIAVREMDGVKILSDLNINATQILDPTFWLDEKEWNALAGDKSTVNEKYIIAYGFELNNRSPQFLIDAARKICNKKVIAIDGAKCFHYDAKYNSCGPIEFLRLIKYSDLVITSSFHGMVFAIIFRKNFFIIPHSTRNSRIENLLLKLDLLNRILPKDSQEYYSYINSTPDINYEIVEEKIHSLRKSTEEYIMRILNRYII